MGSPDRLRPWRGHLPILGLVPPAAALLLAATPPVAAQPPVVPDSAATTPAVPPSPPADLIVSDVPDDAGHALHLGWTPSPDAGIADLLTGYRILRAGEGGDWEEAASLPSPAREWTDTSVEPGRALRYRVVAVGPGGESAAADPAPARATAQWFNGSRLATLVLMVVVCAAIWINILRARSGKKLYIRKIAGMDAVTEAVGRATEMGQPVLYVAGLQDMDNVQTVAGITILGSISKMIAEYDASLLMPTSRSLVMSTARETVKESYLSAGRPDAYREDSIYYVTDEQFGFVAHVDGLMLRKKPATCFYLGAFFAESLILAETGNSIGAIQVAGTAMPTQLPFFVAACDYTLIGEELFAASAYLSQDEKMLGSLKGQDFGKLVAMVSVGVGTLFASIAALSSNAAVAGLNRALQWLWSGGS